MEKQQRRRTKANGDAPDPILAHVERLMALLRGIGQRASLRDPFTHGFGDGQGLTPPQMHAVMWINDERPMTMGVLARRLGITEKTVTGLVDRLEEAKICLRERDPTDRRVVHVVLTETGAALAERLRTILRERLSALLSLLDGDDRDALFRILEKIKDRLGSDEPVRGNLETK